MSIISSIGNFFSGIPAIPEEMDEICQRINLENPKHQRIADGLLYRRDVRAMPSENLTRGELERLARETNAAFLHVSGNCTLISFCMLRNLTKENNALSTRNTSPFYKALSPKQTQIIVFGEKLTCVNDEMKNLDEVEDVVLSNYRNCGERFYALSSEGYQVPLLGESGHFLNAVVLFRENGQPYVQFVDAWKTSNPTPTKDALSEKYEEAQFALYAIPQNLA